MYRFFVEPSAIQGRDIFIGGSDYNHIKNVLRLKPGDTLNISDGVSDKEYRCHIASFTDDTVFLRLDFIKEADIELPIRVALFQGIPKSDKMDYIIEKCTELGVYEVFPVANARSVVKLDKDKAEKRAEHWNKKAEAAAKQSRRTHIPEVHNIVSMEEALGLCADYEHKLIPYELAGNFQRTRDIISAVGAGSSAAIFIGPEGGFTEEEIALAEENGVTPISLGKRILRTETAALVLLSWFIYLSEEG